MTGSGGINIKPGTIARVNCKGHALHKKYVIVDGRIDGWKLIGRDGQVFMMPALFSVRAAEGEIAGERFGLPLLWVQEVPVPPVWAAKLRRQAYGFDKPIEPGNVL